MGETSGRGPHRRGDAGADGRDAVARTRAGTSCHDRCVTPVTHGPVRRFGPSTVDLNRRVAVMAIINRTRDSFFDQGRTFSLDACVAACREAVAAGADIVDIGGVPFSPDAEPVTEDEEIERVLPVVAAVSPLVAVSVDTVRPAVAQAAISAGASIINDTSGLRDVRLADAAAATGAQLVLTHSLAAPGVHLRRPQYGDVVGEIVAFLTERIATAREHGVRDDQLIVDPGPDLNKNTLHTLEVVRRFAEFTALGFPTLIAVSNKDVIGEILDRPRTDRLAGSLAATVACVLAGGRIVRCHDVAPTVDAVRMAEAILGTREPSYLHHNV